MARGGNKIGRSKAKFVQIYHWFLDTEAWATMPPGPRALYVELKRLYNSHNNGAIFLSHRDAAKALSVHRNTIGPWFRVLVERGFIIETRGSFLGPSGVGKASTWALTELETMDGKRATMGFKKYRTPAQKLCIATGAMPAMHKICDAFKVWVARERHSKQDIYTSSHRQDQMTTDIKHQTDKLGFTIKGNAKQGQNITINEADTFTKIFGTKHPELASGLFRHCMKVLNADESCDDLAGNDERVFIVGIVSEIAPRDGVEQMLAVQMAVTHVAMIRAGRYMANASSLEGVKAHNNGFTKLARTYAAQMEALRKHRNGGKQTVTVQHVNVEGGGQAIVGHVQTGEGSHEK